MCWSSEASLVITGVGLAATVVTYQRSDPPAIWMTLGFFFPPNGFKPPASSRSASANLSLIFSPEL